MEQYVMLTRLGRMSPDIMAQVIIVARDALFSRSLVIKLTLAAAAILAALELRLGIGVTAFIGLLVVSATGLIDSRVSVVIGLICLALWPILLIADRYSWLQQSTIVTYYLANAGVYTLTNAADTVVTWAFYFFCIGLVGRIIRYVAQERKYESG